MTSHGVTTRAHLPRAEPGAGSGTRHITPRRGPGGAGSTATPGNGGPDGQAEPEREADEPEFTPVSLESLHQVLDGLRRIN